MKRSMLYSQFSWTHLRRPLRVLSEDAVRAPMGVLRNDALKQLTQSQM